MVKREIKVTLPKEQATIIETKLLHRYGNSSADVVRQIVTQWLDMKGLLKPKNGMKK